MTRRKCLQRLMALVTIGFMVSSCGMFETPRKVEIGMHLHYRGADAATIKRQFDLMAAMGISWVRLDISWAWIESTRGEFDWTASDMFVDEANAHGMNVLAVFATTPEWARASGPGDHAAYSRAANASDLAGFARTATERYLPHGVHTWEIWNEPNLDRFWPPDPDVDEFSEVFRVVASAIRSVDRNAFLLTAGLSPKYDSPDRQIDPRDYLEQLYANGTAYLADGIALHPYSFPAMPMDLYQRMDGGFRDLPTLRSVMVNHGDAHKKIWITEYGVPTGTGRNAVSESDQARNFLEARRQVARWDWIGPLMYYELTDDGTNPSDSESNFGVFRDNLEPKQAATDLMEMATASETSNR